MIRLANLLQLWYSFALFLPLFIITPCSSALNSDGTLLLSFKYSVLSDPLSVLENWNYDDQTPCSWTGVTCELQTGLNPPEMLRVISLVLPNSHLLGSIPQDLGLLQYLRSLDLSNNSLNGTLPTSLFNSSELQVLSLSSNVISGELPESVDELQSLRLLNLSDNAFAGNVPKSLASLKNLTVISLKNNYFSGTVPGGFDSVEVMDLSSNLFNGSLPLDFGGGRLHYLNLSNNKLSGSVSPEFAEKIPPKATIDLSNNNLTGQIPQTLSLSNQKTEYFTGNLDLCGKPLKNMCTIPSSLSTPPNITTNGTTSAAIAAIPKTIDSSPSSDTNGGTASEANNQTHGGLKVKPGKIAAIVVGDLAGVGLLAILFLYAYQLRKKKINENPTIKPIQTGVIKIEEANASKDTTTRALSTSCSCLNGVNGDETSDAATGSDSDDNNHHRIEVGYGRESEKDGKKEKCLVMVDGESELDMETLLKASAYILGSSGSSIVYKAVLGGGVAFAVRRIGESGVERMKEFENTVRGLAKLRHQNLVRVRGFYWGEDEKLVIYDYISNGSLAGTGYRKVGSSPFHLTFEVRLKIAKGVARGLAYIHEKKYVHGNIKPSNILLTPEMDPVISDLGLEWLVSGKHNHKTEGSARHFGSKRSISSREEIMMIHDHHHSASSSPYVAPATGLLGCTSPYHAPESMKNLKPNPKWDVYSFGIILLELLSGKVFSDRELGQWNAGLSILDNNNSILRMADATIRADVTGREDAILGCFKLGFACASLVPQKRPSMKEALQVLEKIPPCSSHQS